MKIKSPCKLGELLITEKGLYILDNLSWFKWNDGMEYTYFFKTMDKWTQWHFICEKNPDYESFYEISDIFLINDFLKKKGYPVKGRGFVSGLRLFNENLFVEIILTDEYFSHIYVQCGENGTYIEDGMVYVPPSWDTIEKKYSIILNQYKNINVECIPR